MVEEYDRLRQDFLRYVTGRMSREELQRFEERLLDDHEFSDGAAVCEQGLIDDFAANQFEDVDRVALQEWIVASPRRAERLRLSQSLRARAEHKVWSCSWTKLALPTAAIIAGLAVLTWFAGRKLGVKTGSTPETVAKNSPNAGAGPLLPEDQVILVVAERMRSQQRPQLFKEPQKSGAMLQVLLPEGAEDAAYRLRVTKTDGAKGALLDERDVKPTSTGGRLYLAVHIAPGTLAAGSYALNITGSEDSYFLLLTVQQSH